MQRGNSSVGRGSREVRGNNKRYGRSHMYVCNVSSFASVYMLDTLLHQKLSY